MKDQAHLSAPAAATLTAALPALGRTQFFETPRREFRNDITGRPWYHAAALSLHQEARRLAIADTPYATFGDQL